MLSMRRLVPRPVGAIYIRVTSDVTSEIAEHDWERR